MLDFYRAAAPDGTGSWNFRLPPAQKRRTCHRRVTTTAIPSAGSPVGFGAGRAPRFGGFHDGGFHAGRAFRAGRGFLGPAAFHGSARFGRRRGCTWTMSSSTRCAADGLDRIRINLRNVPDGERPPEDPPEPDYDPWPAAPHG